MKLRLTFFIFILSLTKTAFAQGYLENEPFNISTSIKIVSFVTKDSVWSEHFKKYNCPSLPQKGTYTTDVDFSKLSDVKTLNLSQISELAAIAFSEQSGCVSHDDNIVGDCRNIKTGFAVLFFNHEEKVFDVISLCFECEFFSCSSGFELGWLCSKKFQMLRDFFAKMGLKS